MSSLSVTFARGARRVTGSNFLVEAKDGERTTRILIDCGLAQGERFCESVNQEAFSYDPASIDAIFFTHAHADHIGLFPRLVAGGFRGKAYATPPTKALMAPMLEDSLHILSDEAKRCRENPLYSEADIERALPLVAELGYREKTEVAPNVSVTFYNAGHIIGSASAALDIFGTRIVFTGDLGRVPPVLVPERDIPAGVRFLFMESVYGDRIHDSITDSTRMLLAAVKEAAEKKGTLLIPAFSLERTQIILSALETAFRSGATPSMPVFLDSPLAEKVTEVYERFPDYLRADVRERMQKGEDPFSFPLLKKTSDARSSREIDETSSPKIIIAGSGMSHGGRIVSHEARYLPDASTTLLLSGYQAAGSLGRRLKDGAREVEINGARVRVRADVRALDGFSAHADRNDLLSYAEAVKPEKIFVILGETQSSAFLAQRISGFLGIPAAVPREGEKAELPLLKP